MYCIFFYVHKIWYFLDEIYIPALYGAKIKTDERLRCIVMSHGLGGNRFLNTNVCYELASRGFLVAFLEHRYNLYIKLFVGLVKLSRQTLYRASQNKCMKIVVILRKKLLLTFTPFCFHLMMNFCKFSEFYTVTKSIKNINHRYKEWSFFKIL